MANANRPRGLVPKFHLNGSAWNGASRVYSIVASYANQISIGDPVVSSGTADSNGVPGIAVLGAAGSGAASGAIRGVVIGLSKSQAITANPSNLDITYRPASDPVIWYAAVVDDPSVVFEVQEQSNGTALAATEAGLNTVLYAPTTDPKYLSAWQVASASGATPATTYSLQVRLLGLNQVPGNSFGAYAKWLVLINVHELGQGTGAAGV